jgi:hypothetical protein
MANTVIALRQSGATGNTPSLGVLANGELSLNYADGILYYKTAANTLGSIRTTQPAGLTTEIQFNDAGSFGSNSAFNFNKTTGTLNVRNIIVSTNLATTNLTATSITTGSGEGGIISGANVIYSNTFVANSTTTSTSNSTGAIISNGGLGVKGNVYADAIYDGGIEVISFANQAFNQANSKAYIFEQNTAPVTANVSDRWVHADTGVEYHNFGNTSSPVWAEVGPTGVLANTQPGAINASSVSINGNVAVNGPAFSAYPNSSIQQAITSGSQQKVLFQIEEYDTNSNFSSSRFTPTVAGYYQLNATVRISGTMGPGESMLVIWKNGSEYKRGWNASGTEVGANFFAMGVNSMVYANGTGDYFEVYIQQGSGGNRDITVAGGNITYFNGCMLRGA